MFHKQPWLGTLSPAPIICFLWVGLLQYGLMVPVAEAASLAALDNRPPSFSVIAKKTMPVVVNISTTAQRSPRSGSNDPIDEFFSRFLRRRAAAGK